MYAPDLMKQSPQLNGEMPRACANKAETGNTAKSVPYNLLTNYWA